MSLWVHAFNITIIRSQWTDQQTFHRDHLNYIDKGCSGLVFTKSAGTYIFVLKIIDFGLAEDISNLHNKKHIQDILFIKQCTYFTKWCGKLLDNYDWEQSWENVPSDETLFHFLKRTRLYLGLKIFF